MNRVHEMKRQKRKDNPGQERAFFAGAEPFGQETGTKRREEKRRYE